MQSPTTEPRTTFPDWAAQEVNRLLRAREHARTAAERAQYDLQLAVLCDAAHRYGRSLAESSEF
jgi:hypothetical protein